MYNSRIEYAMKNFISEGYFLKGENTYTLNEKAKEGNSVLDVIVDGDNICVEEYDNDKIRGKCTFLRHTKSQGLKKCIDHFILKRTGEKWDLHMIEMKTSVGNKTWQDIKHKNRASYFNIKSLCIVLGIEIEDIYSYTTYEVEKFESIERTTDLKTYMPQLGKKLINFKKDEWDKGKIIIELDEKDSFLTFTHKAIKMIRGEEGELTGKLLI